MLKPIFLTMDEADLNPLVRGGAGDRLAGLLGLGTPAYLGLFDRRGLLGSPDISPGTKIWSEFKGRTVLVLGNEVRAACGLHVGFWLFPYRTSGVDWRLLPDPSPLNQWYNDPARRAAVRILLQELAGAQPHPEDKLNV